MLPDGERLRIPEGRYDFEIISEPEKRGHTSQTTEKKFVSIKFELKAISSNGDEFHVYESMLTFDDRYIDLLIALGAKEVNGKMSGKTIDPVGMTFQGDIIYEKDKNDSSKTYSRIINIGAVESDEVKPKEKDRFEDPEEELPVKSPAEPSTEEDDDECPF